MILNENMILYLAIGIGTVIMLLAGVLLYIGKKGKDRRKSAKRLVFFYRLYFEYMRIPGAKQYVTGMTRRLKLMSVFTRKEIYSRAAMYFTIQMACVFGFLIGGILLFDDIVSIFFCLALSYFVPRVLIDKRLGNMYYRVYKQLRVAIESLRLEYLRCHSVVEALENVECGNRLVMVFDEIKKILISANSEYLMNEFYETVPFLPVQTLAKICYHTENTGDSETKNGGSTFEEALLTMMKDINHELERLNYQANKFGNVEFLCLASYPAIPIIQWFLETYMPASAVMLQGVYGFVTKIAIMAISLYCFYRVATINSMEPFKMDDRIPLLTSLAKNKMLNAFLHDITPKNAKRRKWMRKLGNAFSKKKLEELYLEKIIWAAMGFLVALTTFISAVSVGRNYMLNSTSSLSLIANDDLVDFEKEVILELDEEYMKMRNAGYLFQDEEEIKELDALIKLSLPGLTDMQIYDQKARMEKKYEFLQTAQFHWYYVLVAAVFGCVTWYFPDKFLKDRKKQLIEAEEEEFLQIQTLMMILMGMNCDTMEAIDYLGQLSKIHKEMFVRALHGYASDPEGEIDRMEEKTPVEDMKRFIGKLRLTIEEVSLEDAYADILIDREHIMNVRIDNQIDAIDRKRARCGSLVMAGPLLCVILLFMFPLLYIGYTDMMSGMEQMQNM